jgi:putative thiamine transport system permease protein
VLGLVLKETPYLLLMILAAEPPLRPALAVGRSLGYGPFMAWTKLVLPRLYPLVRLPVLAVLAFSLSVVDVALVLAPNLPPPFAVLLLRWFADPDLAPRFQASAGALLQLLLVAGAIGAWLAGERLVAIGFRAWLSDGRRGRRGAIAERLFEAALALLLLVSAAAILSMALWSIATSWRYPDRIPSGFSLEHWRRGLASLGPPLLTTLVVGLAAAGVAGLLTIGCLEQEDRSGRSPGARALWLLYLPLLMPQVSFLFGLQLLFLRVGLIGHWLGLVWCHLVFVLPYLFLALADPYRALDRRYRRAALCLGASRLRVLLRVVLPLLAPAIAGAVAVGFAVSVGLYLPTVFVGAGRLTSLTTEAVGLAAGADRRVIGVAVMLQAALPLIAFAAALGWPRRRSDTPDRR